MARLFYVHWNREEALETVRELRRAGHTVNYHWDTRPGDLSWKRLTARPPDALVVSLERLPSHGRQAAAWFRQAKSRQSIPVVFVGGPKEKVAAARKQFPAAVFTSRRGLESALGRILT